jgi:uncharacterized protein YjbJ (UPF0337 family)
MLTNLNEMRDTTQEHWLSNSSVWLLTLATLFVAVVWQHQIESKKLSRGTTKSEGVTVMSGKTDVVKGRIKEAAGALAGNDKLREEGQTDQAVGEVKQAVQKVADKVQASAAAVVEKAKTK